MHHCWHKRLRRLALCGVNSSSSFSNSPCASGPYSSAHRFAQVGRPSTCHVRSVRLQGCPQIKNTHRQQRNRLRPDQHDRQQLPSEPRSAHVQRVGNHLENRQRKISRKQHCCPSDPQRDRSLPATPGPKHAARWNRQHHQFRVPRPVVRNQQRESCGGGRAGQALEIEARVRSVQIDHTSKNDPQII